ncbi:MAG TPA: hypothetical protein VGE15_12695 [Sphingobacteriaceae bacterium]
MINKRMVPDCFASLVRRKSGSCSTDARTERKFRDVACRLITRRNNCYCCTDLFRDTIRSQAWHTGIMSLNRCIEECPGPILACTLFYRDRLIVDTHY